MKWNIVTDSSCDLLSDKERMNTVCLSSVPFIISVENRDYTDDETLDTLCMLNDMEQSTVASHTSCPSPGKWAEQFERAEQSIAITISSKLSGSMNSASIAKEIVLDAHPDKKIAVIDSCSTGPEIVMCVEKILEWIKQAKKFEEVAAEAEKYLKKVHIAFALSSFDNLIKNGRMGKITGFVARKLGMWGIGAGSEEGLINMKGKTRGPSKALAMLVEEMKSHKFQGGKVIISHCHNFALAQKLQSRIQEHWNNAEVQILPTRGLCSYYAERGGLIVSY